MKTLLYYFVIILSFVFTQQLIAQKNRFSIQAGLLNSSFDEMPMFIKERQTNFQFDNPHNYFGGRLNESLGFQYQRKINDKSSVSIEYMSLKANHNIFFDRYIPDVQPIVNHKNLKRLNINYNRNVSISDNFEVVFGGGLNYLFGYEHVYHYSYKSGWGYNSIINTHYRNDLGVNLRVGIEYTPIKWLSIFSNLDFMGIVYSNAKIDNSNNFGHHYAKDLNNGKDAHQFYKDNFRIKNIPSRFDLSWRFGIGINF